VTAYAAAHGLGAAVADEVLGPWDRTGPPYNYPRLQHDLMRAHHGARCTLSPEVVDLAAELFDILGAETGKVVCKHPHLRPFPDEFRAAFPSHRFVWLMRNPLSRLNSLYVRGWTEHLRPNYELEHFRSFARNWRSQKQRMIFERLKRNPARFFRAMYRHWGVRPTEDQVARAVAYTQGSYHGSSGDIEKESAEQPVSERKWHLPEAALEMYLADDEVRKLMRKCGYPRLPGAYRESESRWERKWHQLRGRTPPRATPDAAPHIEARLETKPTNDSESNPKPT
jgi:hypothetical protein